jgi:hypothetical protein
VRGEPIVMRGRGILVAIALAAGVAHAQDSAQGWLERGDAALVAWDRVTARQAYERAAAIAATGAEPGVEGLARRKLADVLLALGDRPAATAQYDALARLYVNHRDVPSASLASLRAAQTMLDLDRYDEVTRRAADHARLGDTDPVRRAVMEQLRVTAYARGRHPDLARQALLESRPRPAAGGVEPLPARGRDPPRRVDRRTVALARRSAGRVRRRHRARRAVVASSPHRAGARRGRVPGHGRRRGDRAADRDPRVGNGSTPPAPAEPHGHVPPERGVMPGIDMTETRFTTNAIGLRGREMPPPGTPRWIAVGGSSTESPFLDDADAWTAVLERELREKHGRDVWLGNAGKSGLTTFSHVSELLAYEDEIAPSLVVMQAGFDDMSLCISGGRQDVIDTALRFRHADYPAAYGRFVFHEIRPPGAGSRWRLEALVDRVRERYANDAAAAPEHAFVVQDNAASFYRVLRQRRQEAAKVDAAPALDECLRAYAANLRRIADWAEARKVRLVMLTQGSLYRDAITPADERLLGFGSVDESVSTICRPSATSPCARCARSSGATTPRCSSCAPSASSGATTSTRSCRRRRPRTTTTRT